MQNADSINFTPEVAKEYIAAYNRAISTYKKQFSFDGRQVLVLYAQYTIEFMVTQRLIKGNFDKDKKFILS